MSYKNYLDIRYEDEDTSEIKKKYCHVFFDVLRDLKEGFRGDLAREDIEAKIIIKNLYERFGWALKEYTEYKDLLFQMVAENKKNSFNRASFCIDLYVNELKGLKALGTIFDSIDEVEFSRQTVMYLRGVMTRCERYLAAALDFIHPSILPEEHRELGESSDYAKDVVALFS